jgi:hypothetical protein
LQFDLTTISTIVGLGSVIVGIIASLLSIRRFTQSRKLGIFLEYSKLLYDTEFIKDINEIQTWTWSTVEEFFTKYGPETDPDAFAKYFRVGSYFDGLSTLVQRKYMDFDFIPETTAITLISFWDKFQPTADGLAEVFRRPGCWDAIKYLYERLQKTDVPPFMQ